MTLTYRCLAAEQDSPEESPNEVAYRLSGLTGLDHFACHQALLRANPALGVVGEELVVTAADLLAVCQALTSPTSAWTPETTTA